MSCWSEGIWDFSSLEKMLFPGTCASVHLSIKQGSPSRTLSLREWVWGRRQPGGV